ncbi:hypothetical protein FRC10_005885 [Ceratobasidium sp. 414]|nr:hypothetical protein FRC10_005885 [Ceratobasidium sp. 414]
MARLKRSIGIFLVIAATLFETTAARLINTTIYDTNLGHVTYEPKDDFCVRWMSSWTFQRTCEVWAQPWRPDVYFSKGRFVTMHRSLNHQLPSVTVEFEGSAIWLYGPPRAQLASIPPDYKICLYENHRLASDEVCYRVDVAEAYSSAEHYDEPVVIFAKGGLQHQHHRVVVSVGDPIDNARAYLGIQFSHATLTSKTLGLLKKIIGVSDKLWFTTLILCYPTIRYHAAWARGWMPKTYRAEDGTVVSWHELKSRDEWNKDLWGVETTITGKLDTGQICVRIDSGGCEIVDVQHAYLNWEHHHESVLLWRHDALDPSRKTHVAIRLMKTVSDETSVFPFKAIHYLEPQEYSSPDSSVGHLENVEVAHDDGAIVYYPGRRCVRHFVRRCTKWFDPWVWREEGPSESRLTYRSTVSSYRTTEDPAITLDFQGSAVYVYGAPKSFIKAPFAPQHVCINDICHVVDVEQAYLNAPVGIELQSADQRTPSNRELETKVWPDAETLDNVTLSNVHPEYEPVLIWSMTGLDDRVTHNLRLALAALPSDENAEMSIAKVVYTKVSYEPGQPRPDTPIAQPDPRYDGPAYPPYAKKWVPRRPLPPLPTPSRPPPPPSLPTPPSRPAPAPAPPSSAGGTLTIITAAISLALIFTRLHALLSDRGERGPLLPRPRGNPVYSNGGIRVYAKA